MGYQFFKRAIDLLVALTSIIILTPILIPIMIGLLMTGEGYIFYKQKRVGYQNQNFFILKFATMLKNSPNIGSGLITLRNDPRITPMGGFLRKTKINELPQLFNILKGDISLVGPRPLVDKTFQAYSRDVQRIIYQKKPGLTGIGSIVFRDEEAILSNTTMNPHDYYVQMIAPYKGTLEIWYQNRASFWLDLKIIFLTAWVIIFPESELAYKWFPDLPAKPEF